MRLRLNFSLRKELVLPIHYNQILQGFIYRNLEPKLATKIHDYGHPLGKRRFKLFHYSQILKRGRKAEDEIIFKNHISIVVGSPLSEFLESLATTLIKKSRVKMGDCYLFLESIEVIPTPKFTRESLIRTLSPITVYSTLFKPDGRKKTYYYTPFEQEFSELIHENLKKKYEVLKGRKPARSRFTITPLRASRKNLIITRFRGTLIKAWSGKYLISGTKSLLEIAYDCGLGAKNSQGFGMIIILH